MFERYMKMQGHAVSHAVANSRTQPLTLIVAGLFCLLTVACSAEPSRARVTDVRRPWLGYAEFAPYVDVATTDGQQTRIGRIGGPFFALAFVEKADPYAPEPALAELARKVWLDSIMIIQVSLPDQQADGADFPAAAHSDDLPPNLVCIDDGQCEAWMAYGRPEPGTVLIIDRMHILQVVDFRGHITQTHAVRNRLAELQANWESWTRSAYD
jgi:hypothetical protein